MSLQNFILNKLIRHNKKQNMALSSERRFKRLRKVMALDTGAVSKDVVVKPDIVAGVPVEWVYPKSLEGDDSTDICVYFHGGAFVMGGMNSHRHMAAYLCKQAKLKMLMVDYRLAPEHPFPAAVDDTMAVYRELIGHGRSPQKLILAGDSAGGNLALVCMQQIRDAKMAMPKAFVLFSPWLDFTYSSPAFVENNAKDVLLNQTILSESAAMYAADHSLEDRRISPLEGSVAGLPPCFIIASRIEVLRDDSRRLRDSIETAGGTVTYREWKNVPHAFPVFCKFLPEAKRALKDSAAFIGAH
ncbi:MAG: monoterpene epsilon-lactone hydrolase [Zhongshania sp.]|jgi:monoterpene epsilon-lactone hydrolase